MEKENKTTMNQAKDDVKQGVNAAREDIAKASMTTKQKVMIGTTVVAAAGAGFAAGYVVGKRKKKDSQENIETKELD